MATLRNFNGLASWRNAENSPQSANVTMPYQRSLVEGAHWKTGAASGPNGRVARTRVQPDRDGRNLPIDDTGAASAQERRRAFPGENTWKPGSSAQHVARDARSWFWTGAVGVAPGWVTTKVAAGSLGYFEILLSRHWRAICRARRSARSSATRRGRVMQGLGVFPSPQANS